MRVCEGVLGLTGLEAKLSTSLEKQRQQLSTERLSCEQEEGDETHRERHMYTHTLTTHLMLQSVG